MTFALSSAFEPGPRWQRSLGTASHNRCWLKLPNCSKQHHADSLQARLWHDLAFPAVCKTNKQACRMYSISISQDLCTMAHRVLSRLTQQMMSMQARPPPTVHGMHTLTQDQGPLVRHTSACRPQRAAAAALYSPLLCCHVLLPLTHSCPLLVNTAGVCRPAVEQRCYRG